MSWLSHNLGRRYVLRTAARARGSLPMPLALLSRCRCYPKRSRDATEALRTLSGDGSGRTVLLESFIPRRLEGFRGYSERAMLNEHWFPGKWAEHGWDIEAQVDGVVGWIDPLIVAEEVFEGPHPLPLGLLAKEKAYLADETQASELADGWVGRSAVIVRRYLLKGEDPQKAFRKGHWLEMDWKPLGSEARNPCWFGPSAGDYALLERNPMEPIGMKLRWKRKTQPRRYARIVDHTVNAMGQKITVIRLGRGFDDVYGPPGHHLCMPAARIWDEFELTAAQRKRRAEGE